MCTESMNSTIREFKDEFTKTLEWLEKIKSAYSCEIGDITSPIYSVDESYESIRLHEASSKELRELENKDDFRPWNRIIPAKAKEIIATEECWADAYYRIEYMINLLEIALDNLEDGQNNELLIPLRLLEFLLAGFLEYFKSEYEDNELCEIPIDLMELLLLL